MRLYLAWRRQQNLRTLSVAALIVGALLVLMLNPHPHVKAQTATKGGCGPDPTGLGKVGKAVKAGLAQPSGKSPNGGGWCGGRSGDTGGSNVPRNGNTKAPPNSPPAPPDCDGLRAKLKYLCEAHKKGDESASQKIDDISDQWARSKCGNGYGIGCPCVEHPTNDPNFPCGRGQDR